MITHLEPDMLKCEVKWALGSIIRTKLVEVMEFQLSYFNLKDDAVKVLHSMCQQNLENSQLSQERKWSVFIPIPKKGNAKECSNYCTIVLISHASK